MRRQLKPPPRVTPFVSSGGAGLPHAPPPRIDYIEARHQAEPRPPQQKCVSEVDSRPKEMAAAPTSPPPVELDPDTALSFDADVQREMMKLEEELRKQLAQEEQLMKLNTLDANKQSSPRSSYDHVSSSVPYRDGDRGRASYDMSMPSMHQPSISVVAPDHRQDPVAIVPPANEFQEPRRERPSYEEWLAQNYPEEVGGSRNKGGDEYTAKLPQFDSRVQVAMNAEPVKTNPNFPLGTSSATRIQGYDSNGLHDRGLQKNYRTKGSAISNLFEADPERVAKEKWSKQNEYRRELEKQIEEKGGCNDRELGRQKSLEALNQIKPYEESYSQRRYSTSPKQGRNQQQQHSFPEGYAVPLSVQDEQRMRKRKEQEEYRQMLIQQQEENRRLKVFLDT